MKKLHKILLFLFSIYLSIFWFHPTITHRFIKYDLFNPFVSMSILSDRNYTNIFFSFISILLFLIFDLYLAYFVFINEKKNIQRNTPVWFLTIVSIVIALGLLLYFAVPRNTQLVLAGNYFLATTIPGELYVILFNRYVIYILQAYLLVYLLLKVLKSK